MGRTVLSLMAVALCLLQGVRPECSAQNWQDCKGKPWVTGEEMETPLGSSWWPHPIWGAGDEAGATNWYSDPEIVLRAIREADKGVTYKLGMPYDAGIPIGFDRVFSFSIPGAPTRGPFGANRQIFFDDLLVATVSQVGTQFDGLGHVGIQIGEDGNKAAMRFYNGFVLQNFSRPTGHVILGAEKLKPIVARGVLLDVAGMKGVEMLEEGYEITMQDVNKTLDTQGMEGFAFAPGDGVFFRTGWIGLWGKNNTRFTSGEPVIWMEVARWLTDEVNAGVYGSDTAGSEVRPPPDPACFFCVHDHMLTRHGIVHQENMNLDDLAADRVYTFMYVYTPVPIAGATGSMGSPLAID